MFLRTFLKYVNVFAYSCYLLLALFVDQIIKGRIINKQMEVM